eukprot:11424060-Karenia_brevis.AAC.1
MSQTLGIIIPHLKLVENTLNGLQQQQLHWPAGGIILSQRYEREWGMGKERCLGCKGLRHQMNRKCMSTKG